MKVWARDGAIEVPSTFSRTIRIYVNRLPGNTHYEAVVDAGRRA